MSEQSQEKTDHELDIRRSDERAEYWQIAQRWENLGAALRLQRLKAKFAQAARDNFHQEWDLDQSANLRRMLNLPAEPNAHVAKPLADVLNKFAGEKGEQ